jgi:poly(A) polymerase
LRLRADTDEVSQELAEWWEDYSLGTEEEREALLQALKASQTRRVQTGRARSAPTQRAGVEEVQGASAAPQEASEETPGGMPERKRRRRRRRGDRGTSGDAPGDAPGGAQGPGAGEPQ